MGKPEQENYMNIFLIISDYATNIIRKAFQEMWTTFNNGGKWGNTKEDGQLIINGIGNNIYKKGQKIQKKIMESGDINKWDLPLLVKILRELNDRQENSVKTENIQKIKDLKILIDIRNELAHSGSPFLNNEEFEAHLSAISKVLMPFGVTDEELMQSLNLNSNVADPDPKKVTPVNKENTKKALLLKEEGNRLLKTGDLNEAINRYSEALILPNISPKDQAVLYSNRCKAYLDLEITKQIQNAIEDAIQATTLCPRWGKGYFRAAAAYETSGNLEEAIKFYSIALALEPTNAEIEKLMANCQFKQSLKKIGPKSLHRMMHDCLENSLVDSLSDTKLGSGKKGSAVQKKLTNEDSYFELLKKGYTYRSGGKFHEAGGVFRKALSVGPKQNAEASYNLAMVLIESKAGNCHITEAIELLTKAAEQKLKGNIGVAESQFILGLYHQEGMKDFKTAIFWYARAALNGNGLAANNLAIMHDEGIGMLVDKDTAVELWEKAAKSKDEVVTAMECLAKHSLETYDFKNAIKWHAAAVEHGSQLLTPGDFKSKVEPLKIMYLNWKGWDKISVCRNDPEMAEVAEVAKIKVDSEIRNILKTYFNKYEPEDKITPVNYTGVSAATMKPLKNNDYAGTAFQEDFKKIKELKKSAKLGNDTAKILLETYDHYTKAFNIVRSLKANDELSINTMIKEMASAICLELSFISVSVDISDKLCQIVKERMMKGETEKSELDKDTRICYIFVSMIIDRGNADRSLYFAKECIEKYPDEPYFYEMQGTMYGFKRNYSTGVKAMNEAVELFPRNHSILYCRAALGMQCTFVSSENGIKDYLEFIKYAPNGNKKIPEAYYTIALFCLEIVNKTKSSSGTMDKMAYNNVAKYIELAQQAEKSLAPCYLPYNDHFKKDALDAFRTLSLARKIFE